MTIEATRKNPLTRAEQLRRKRAPSGARNLQWSARPAAPRPAAPQTEWHIRPRGTASRPQKVMNFRLAEPGVEVQVPVLTLSFSPAALAILIAGLACAGMLFLLSAPMFRVESPAVRGLQYLAPDAVVSAAGVVGGNVFLVSPAAAAAEIVRKIPAVRSAAVNVDFDGKVTIAVVERDPILLWEQGGVSYWVDAGGVFFPALAERSDLVRLTVRDRGPEITFDGAADIDPRVVVQTLELTVALPSGTQLIYDGEHGLGMMDPAGWMVYFGSSGDIPQKLDVYRRLIDSLTGRGIRPGMVSVENLRQPFYRR
jgi:hypothetical protein